MQTDFIKSIQKSTSKTLIELSSRECSLPDIVLELDVCSHYWRGQQLTYSPNWLTAGGRTDEEKDRLAHLMAFGEDPASRKPVKPKEPEPEPEKDRFDERLLLYCLTTFLCPQPPSHAIYYVLMYLFCASHQSIVCSYFIYYSSLSGSWWAPTLFGGNGQNRKIERLQNNHRNRNLPSMN